MLYAENWPALLLLVGITIRGGNQYSFLLDHATQEQLMEYVVTNFAREITAFSSIELSEESFEILRAVVPAGRILTGD
jgi:hypothetical protein